MSEETTTPVEHVSIGENGVIMLSPEAEEVMNRVEVPPEEEAPAQPTSEPQPEPEKAEARKIKWNGQEVEVKPEEEVALLQKGYNYEQKMQQLEAERARIQAYNGLVSAIEASPDIKAKVAAALGHNQQATPPQTPEFDDPIEQLKWEVRQETLREVEERFAKPVQQQMQQTAHLQTLNAVKQQVQADPQFDAIQAEIIRSIQTMPESIGRELYTRLDNDPQAYLDMFKTVKQRLGTNTQSQTQPESTELPAATKRETKAPLLETGTNSEPSAEAQKAYKEKIKELERRSRNGDFRATGELLELLP